MVTGRLGQYKPYVIYKYKYILYIHLRGTRVLKLASGCQVQCNATLLLGRISA